MGKTVQVYGFPSNVTAEEAKSFLERHTGAGTVEALKMTNGGPRLCATVQFSTIEMAAYIISKTMQLYYGRSYLKTRPCERDIIPKPRTYLHVIESAVLHFGCQTSVDKFSDLWRSADVLMRFGQGMRKLHFLLSHHGTEYRLDLSYDNIWQIELHRPRGQFVKYLVFQLFGAPRIFKKDLRLSELDSLIWNYFKDGADHQWVRTTDFTPSCRIGHASALCLEVPRDFQLPNLAENFAYYKDTDAKFNVESGFTFSQNPTLVPIVGPPLGVSVPYEMIFKVSMLVQNGCLPGPALDANFYKLIDPQRFPLVCIENALEKLYYMKECCYEPSKWLQEQYTKYMSSPSQQLPKSPSISLDDGLVYVHRIQITPCKVYFSGPEVNVSNRVLRQFSEDISNFIRVSFVDEELEKIHSNDVAPRGSSTSEAKRSSIYNRILSTLRNGIVIGGKKFEFLAFSSSQLRENSCWMFASRIDLSAADIRDWMGNFRQIKNVAKYAARLGQSFGSSTETLSVSKEDVENIPDIEVKTGGTKYIFSDGIGKISAQFAKRVAAKCNCNTSTPSAFQIRYGGYKGVVAVDPTSSKKLSLRQSMCKYESDNIKLDVLAYSKYQPCFMNRQLITLLSTLGIPDHVFEKKQKEAVDQLDAILTNPSIAMEALELMPMGELTNVLKDMLICGYKPGDEPFLSMILQNFRASKLLDIRTKTRVFLQKARSMMGCLDETRTLEYGQVFVQFSGSGNEQYCKTDFARRSILKGNIVVAKNPCLHPGDIRVLRAVDVPALHHMVDCVVFPQKGHRPHPNECSGSDLDGDIYFVCWDPELVPSQQIAPMDYTPPPTVQLDHDVTIEEVEEYFTNYIVNDSLGIIANAHIAFADKEPAKAMSPKCVQLAEMFSVAVDFPKTGVPAEIPSHLYVKEYPDFMEKPDKPTYQSNNVIGKLFREVKDIAPHTACVKSFTLQVARQCYDPDMEVDGFERYLHDAHYYKSNYDYKLGNQMDYYGIKTEAEMLSGNIMKLSRSFTKRRDSEAISMAVRSLKKEARSWFNEKGSSLDAEEDDDDVYAKASAWYHVTYHPDYWGVYNEGMNRPHFLSFPWCVYDKLIQIKKKKKIARMSALERQFQLGLRLS
ncbi:RNA-dependent RNA polymerase 1 [Linum grandiflorum]